MTSPLNNMNAWLARRLFAALIPHRHRATPQLPGAQPYRVRSRDGVAIAGWHWHPAGADHGTVVFVHGLLRNSTMDGIPDWARAMAEEFGLSACALDLRGHGLSQSALPTFGAHESWDIRATLDECERQKFPQPYIVLGGSLGALAAQRAAWEDERIGALILLSMPAKPWHGCRVGAKAIARLASEEARARLPGMPGKILGALFSGLGHAGRLVGMMIRSACGCDVLSDGDIAKFPRRAHRRRQPLLAVMGSADGFDWRATYRVFSHWPGRAAPLGRWPEADPGFDKWFVLAAGRTHPPNADDLLHWPELRRLISGFLRVYLPMQKREKICSSTSSGVVAPMSSPSASAT